MTRTEKLLPGEINAVVRRVHGGGHGGGRGDGAPPGREAWGGYAGGRRIRLKGGRLVCQTTEKRAGGPNVLLLERESRGVWPLAFFKKYIYDDFIHV